MMFHSENRQRHRYFLGTYLRQLRGFRLFGIVVIVDLAFRSVGGDRQHDLLPQCEYLTRIPPVLMTSSSGWA